MNNPTDHAVPNEITVRELRWILGHADGDLTLAEARAEFVESERRADVDAAHFVSQIAYSEYLERRRERGTEQVMRAADEAQAEATRGAPNPVTREDLAALRNSAADRARIRFDAVEPCLEFPEWVAAGSPDVHRIGDPPRLQR